jgi:hypothetical protein
MSPKFNFYTAVLGSTLPLVLIVLQIIIAGIDIRTKSATTAPAPPPPPLQQDIKTGSIQKKLPAKVKPVPEVAPAFLEDPIAWFKKHAEQEPLRDRYTRD